MQQDCILWFCKIQNQNGLLNPDGKDHGPYMNLAEVLESTKPEDNPILIVVRLKNQKN
jgi:hypothetical protein